jgi:hypothetical protein
MYTSAGAPEVSNLSSAFQLLVLNTSGTIAGEFWLDYEVEFSSPVTSQNLTSAIITNNNIAFETPAGVTAGYDPDEVSIGNTEVYDFRGERSLTSSILTSAAVAALSTGVQGLFIPINYRISGLKTSLLYRLLINFSKSNKSDILDTLGVPYDAVAVAGTILSSTSSRNAKTSGDLTTESRITSMVVKPDAEGKVDIFYPETADTMAPVRTAFDYLVTLGLSTIGALAHSNFQLQGNK